MNFFYLYIDDVQIPLKPLEPDFNIKQYVDAYHTLYSGTGTRFLDDGYQITRADFPNGYCLFKFDLTADMSTNDLNHWNLIKHGSVQLDVRFSTSTAVTLNCLMYAEFLNILEIYALRQVIVDFARLALPS